jgi:cytochrome b561
VVNLREVAEMLGSVVVGGFIFVMLNFFLKFINKSFVSKLPKDKKKYKDTYLLIMKFVVKYHKLAGILISVAIIIHLVLMSVFIRISITGIIAFFLMFSVFILGLYGAFINKNYKGIWLKIHRVLAFLLILAIIIHVI